MHTNDELLSLLNGSEAEKREALASLLSGLDMRSNTMGQQLESLNLLGHAWKVVQDPWALTNDRAMVKAYAAAIFYFGSSTPSYSQLLFQLVPTELTGWAHLGNRVGDSMENNETKALHPVCVNTFCALDLELFTTGSQMENLQSLAIWLNTTGFEVDEFLANNNWFKALELYSPNSNPFEPVTSMYRVLAEWFPEYESYLLSSASLNMTFSDIAAMIPKINPDYVVELPPELS